jgi:hypothetical protein
MIKENMGPTILFFWLNIASFLQKKGHAPSTSEKVGGKCLQINKNNMSMAM